MNLLAIEVTQLADYYVSRYQQIEAYGATLSLLCGEAHPEHWPATRFRVAGTQDLDHLIEMARAWHAETPFDGVLTFAESSVIATAAIADALGLPGPGVEVARTCRNKRLMREAHARHGAAHPPFTYVTSLQAARDAAALIGYPVILKPTLGAGSSFVFRVNTPEELTLAYEEAERGIEHLNFYLNEGRGIDLGPHGLLIEGFLDGAEYLVEAYAWDGEVILGSVVDRVTVEGVTFDDDVHHAPTALTATQLEAVRAVVTRGAHAQGLHRSVMHAEIRFHHGEPYILEIAARPGGGGLDHMARLSAGYCPIRAAMDVARGERPFARAYTPTKVHTAAMVLLCSEGRVERIHIPGDVREDDRVFFVKILARPGDTILRPPRGNNIVGFLGTQGESFAAAMHAAEQAAAAIRVDLQPAVPA